MLAYPSCRLKEAVKRVSVLLLLLLCMLLAGGVDQISRAELRLTDIADALQSDWVPLGRQLGLTQPEIIAIQRDYAYVSEQVINHHC